MSAARWRGAMNAGAGRQAWQHAAASARSSGSEAVRPGVLSRSGASLARGGASLPWGGGVGGAASGTASGLRGPRWLGSESRIAARHVLVMIALLIFPLVASPFFTYQIAAQSLILGMIALSLTFLGGYGGMISLAQMTVAGVAGYTVGILGVNGTPGIDVDWPWWAIVPIAVLLAVIASTLIGWLSVRTEGIYTIMITLAIGVAFYYLTLQNYSVFNGFQGLQQLVPPTVLGVRFTEPVPFYFLVLLWALAGYFFVKHLIRTPFGIALQGIRDNPRRMNSLGFNVTAHRVAAYAVAGLIAGVAGVLMVWYNRLVTPGSIGTSWLINILVIAVLGGMRHPIGPFLGAIIFVLLQTFAIDLIDRERFNLVIGGVFLAIVLFSPDGLLGLWARLSARLATDRRAVASNLRP
jgi:branched-chain amino acid transport system permease protein